MESDTNFPDAQSRDLDVAETSFSAFQHIRDGQDSGYSWAPDQPDHRDYGGEFPDLDSLPLSKVLPGFTPVTNPTAAVTNSPGAAVTPPTPGSTPFPHMPVQALYNVRGCSAAAVAAAIHYAQIKLCIENNDLFQRVQKAKSPLLQANLAQSSAIPVSFAAQLATMIKDLRTNWPSPNQGIGWQEWSSPGLAAERMPAPSWLFLYYNARVMSFVGDKAMPGSASPPHPLPATETTTVANDSPSDGASNAGDDIRAWIPAFLSVQMGNGVGIRDVLKALDHYGAPPQHLWDVPLSQRNQVTVPSEVQTQPSPWVYTAGAISRFLPIVYHRLQRDLAQMKRCLFAGFPFLIGFRVYSSFNPNPETGIGPSGGNIPMPDWQQIIEQQEHWYGHAALVVGYDDSRQQFRALNSWGDRWGDHGYFNIPYAYLLDERLTYDFWVVGIDVDTGPGQQGPTWH
jgi:hypothetical protein